MRERRVRINRSTRRVPLWSPIGAKTCATPLVVHQPSVLFAVNAVPWSVRIAQGKPKRSVNSFKNFTKFSAVGAEQHIPNGNRENRSIATNTYCCEGGLAKRGPRKAISS